MGKRILSTRFFQQWLGELRGMLRNSWLMVYASCTSADTSVKGRVET